MMAVGSSLLFEDISNGSDGALLRENFPRKMRFVASVVNPNTRGCVFRGNKISVCALDFHIEGFTVFGTNHDGQNLKRLFPSSQ